MRRRQSLVNRRGLRRRLFLEVLEGRRLLVATDLASISGLVFDDFSGNGFDTGEEVAGAAIALYRDNGDGSFQQSTDALERSTTTDAGGRYEFSRLTAGNYFVLQDAQMADGRTLLRAVSPLLTIGPTDVEGQIVMVIDDFDMTQQAVSDSTNDGVPVTSSITAPEAIGGERDLYVNKTSVNGAVQLSVDDPLLPNLLIFDSVATGNGERRVTWDGPDGTALTVDDTGLGSIDITSESAASGVQLQIGADLPGGNAVVRLYSDDGSGSTSNRFSTATLSIPQTGGTVPFLAEFLPFTAFSATSGGGADLNNIGAIELEISGAANVNGSAELVGTVGPTIFTQNFANFESADLRLSKVVDDATPNLGQNVSFTITLNNDGPQGATNVAVRDQLPQGLSFVSATESHGTFSNATGIWTIGSVAGGGSATLTLVARVDSAGTHTNFAEVSASDQFDPDSTPDVDNSQPDDESEDDQALVTLVTESIDLSLIKTAVPSSVVVGSNVTFTLTLANAGPSTATNVVVEDQLPSGISFVSAAASQGSYNSQTARWDVGSVATDASLTLTLVGRVDVAGPKTNTAQVVAADQADVDSTPGNNVPDEDDQDSVTIEAPQIDLSLTKTVDNTTPDVGEEFTFTLTVANAGPNDASGVRVRDLIPPSLQFVSASTASGSYSSATGIWDVGTILTGGNATLSITVAPTLAMIVTNVAEVIAADQPDVDSTPDNNIPSEDDQDEVTVGAVQIDVSLVKSVDDARPNVGDTIEFVIMVENAGPNEASGVVVQDSLPVGLRFVSATATSGTYSAASGQWTVGTIAAASGHSLTILARVDQSEAMTNVAEVIAASPGDLDSTPGNGDPSEDDQDSIVITPQVADLSLTKSVSNEEANVGENVTFQVSLQNDGPDPATGVIVRDELPTGITFVSATPSLGTYDVATGLWTVGTVPSSGNALLAIVGRIDTSGAKTNTAQVNASDQFDPDSVPGNSQEAEDDQDSVVVTPPVIDLSLDKQVDIERPAIGETIRFTVTVDNDGPDNASGVVVADELPPGVTFVASSASSGSYNPNTGRWNVGEIPANSSATLTIDVSVEATLATTNAAEVFAADQFDIDSTPGNGSPNEDDYDEVTFVPAMADLSLTKNVDNNRPNVGENVTFTIVVSNAGPDPASGVSVQDRLPTGLSFVSASPQAGSYNQVSGVWDLGNLSAGGSATLSLVATSTTAELVTNVAEVRTSNQLDPDSSPGNGDPNEDDQASVTVEGQQIDLQLTKQVDNERPNVGDEVRFTVRVENVGPSDATGVSVRDLLPDGITLQSSNASRGGYSPLTGIWDIGSIAVDGSATLDLFAVIDQILSDENVAEVISADQPDVDSTPDNGIPSEDDQDAVPIITQVSDLSLTKTTSRDRPNVGEEFTFTVTLRNDGPDAATNIVVMDALPEGVSFVSSAPSQGGYDPQSGRWTVGNLNDGAVASLQIVALVESIGEITNTAELIAVDQADPDSTPNNNVGSEDDQDSVTIDPPVIDLSLAKGAAPLRPSVGGELVYTVVLRNNGPDAASGIVVNDQLPGSTTFVSATPSVGQFDSNTGNWSVASLAAGASATLVLRTTVNEPGEPENRAQVMDADQFDSDSTPGNDDGIDDNGNDEDDQAAVQVVTANADLSLTKSIDNDRPGVGSNVTFTVRVANSGEDDALNVVIQDQIPPGMTFVSSNASVGSYSATTGQWTIPRMVVGKIENLDIVATVNTVGERVSTAEVIASSQFDPDSIPNNNLPDEDDQDSVTFIPEIVDLALAKLVDNPTPDMGEVVRFSIIIANSGPSTATEVMVKDQFPSGLTIRAINATQGVYDPATGIWNVGMVPVGVNPRLDIDASVDSPQISTNVAEISSVRQPDVDSTPGNGDPEEDDFGQVTITPQVADLRLSKSVNNAAPNQDDELIFTMVVTNDGPARATNVAVRDILPDGVTFLRSTVTTGSYSPNSGVWTIPSIESGSAASLQVVVALNSKVPIRNEAEIVASEQFDPDSTPDNQVFTEDDFADVTVTPKVIDISVSASTDKEMPNLGEVFQMVFRVTNSGPDNATGVRTNIVLPPGLTQVSARPGRGTFVAGLWTIGNIAAGETVELTITARAESRGTQQVNIEVIAHQQADRDSDPNNHIESEDDQTSLMIRVPLFSKRLFLSS